MFSALACKHFIPDSIPQLFNFVTNNKNNDNNNFHHLLDCASLQIKRKERKEKSNPRFL